MTKLIRAIAGIVVAALGTSSASASATPRAWPTFAPCSSGPRGLILEFTADQRDTFIAGESEPLHLVLINKGGDITKTQFLPIFRTLQLNVRSKSGRQLAQEPYPKLPRGAAAGGSGYLPSGAQIFLAANLDAYVPEMRAPGTYDLTAIFHVYFKDSDSYACIESPTRTITVTNQ
jgi:hypothetical protein